jgi:tetratricopeptide (TPR) repeat protein
VRTAKPSRSAIADFDKTIALDPKDASVGAAYFNRGNSYQAKGELDRAIADYDKAIPRSDPRGRTFVWRSEWLGSASDSST